MVVSCQAFVPPLSPPPRSAVSGRMAVKTPLPESKDASPPGVQQGGDEKAGADADSSRVLLRSSAAEGGGNNGQVGGATANASKRTVGVKEKQDMDLMWKIDVSCNKHCRA